MSDRIKIDNKHHLNQSWLVHTLLSDFELEDVWRVPVVLKEDQSFELFLDSFLKSNDKVIKAGSLAGLLFKFRLFLGKIFKWDEKKKIDHLIPGSIRERYAKSKNLSFQDLIDPGKEDFIPVYKFENEFLSEIENKTVHAALHQGRVKYKKDYTVQMAVYVKPKGIFGRLYMQVIKPFRYWIVYPALMKSAKVTWEKFLAKQSANTIPKPDLLQN